MGTSLVDLVCRCNAVDIGQGEDRSVDHEIEVASVGVAAGDGVDLMPAQAKVMD